MKSTLHLGALMLFAFVLLGNSSCIVVKSDNGKHKGWYKNTNNPHNPVSTNPAHSKSKSAPASKGKGKK